MPSLGSRPPGGATRWPAPLLLTVAIRIKPSAAARSAYSPSRPMWPNSDRSRRPARVALALGMTRSSKPMRLDLSQPPLAVDHDHAWRLVLDLEIDPDPVVAFAEEVDVLGKSEDAVRVVTSEVGPDQVAGDDRGIVLGDPDGGRTGESRSRAGSAHGGSARRVGPGGRGRSRREFDLTSGPGHLQSAAVDGRMERRGDPSPLQRRLPGHGIPRREDRTRRADRLHPARRVDRGHGLGPAVLRVQPVRPPAAGRRRGPPGGRGRGRLPRQPDQPRPERHARSFSRSRTGSATANIRSAGSPTRSRSGPRSTRSTASPSPPTGTSSNRERRPTRRSSSAGSRSPSTPPSRARSGRPTRS